MQNGMRCGIDFGTSNTTMAVLRPDSDLSSGLSSGGSRLVALEGDSPVIPTAVFYTEKNRSVLFGRQAVAAYMDGQEGRFMRSLKRVLGTALMDSSVVVNGARTSFDVIIGRFLSHIKTLAERQTGAALRHVTMGRPVHFQNDDPDADQRAEEQLRRIALATGFESVNFRYEPVAAALTHERGVQGEKLALVIDIGGGTSDFSVIRLSRDYARDRDRAQDILGNSGVRVGGNDCDKAINLATAMPHLGMGSRFGDKDLDAPLLVYHELSEWAKVNWCYTPQQIIRTRELLREAHEPVKIARLEQTLEDQLGHRILSVSEDVKITLSEHDSVARQLDFLDGAPHMALTRVQMNDLLEKTLEPVRIMMLDSLALAGVSARDIALVVLTGGSTGLPVFRSWVAEYFPDAVISHEDRLGSVGAGLVL